LIRAAMVNFEGAQTRECKAKIADARPNIELLIAFVVLDLLVPRSRRRSSVAPQLLKYRDTAH